MALLNHSPNLTMGEAKQIAAKHYGIDVDQVKALPSERDQNFKLRAIDGRSYVLKLANSMEERVFLEAQTLMISHVAQRANVVAVPIVANDGVQIVQIARNGLHHFARLVPYLDGIPLASIKQRPRECLADLGRRVGQFRNALVDFDHPAFHRDFHWDLAGAHQIVLERLDQVSDPKLKRLIRYFALQFERHAAPTVASLPRSVIHSDMNDGNVIVHSGHVSGVIDFGDAVYSWSVADLAIAIAYAVLEQNDPLSLAATMAAACHGESPLAGNELEVLFGLVCLRLCASAVIACEQQQQRPDDPYLSVSQEPIRRTLPVLEQIPYKIATATFRRACGYAPVDENVIQWLSANQSNFHPPVAMGSSTPAYTVLDLSVSSSSLPSDLDATPVSRLTEIVFQAMAAEGADIGIGRYLEPRLVYASDQFVPESLAAESRTVHLGIDLFAPAGTPVMAPLDGVVQCVVQIDLPLDYGNLVILRHEPSENVRFFTLYGHLADSTADVISVGQVIQAGDAVGVLGDASENGGWPPHLHFQIALDLLDYEDDFPGVCVASQEQAWSSICPDPNLVLGLPAALNLTGKSTKSHTLAERRRRIGPSLSIGYDEPLKITRGWKHWLFDDTGRRYLDAYNNVPHVGHCHPQVVEAMTKQAGLLNTNTRYLSDQINEFAARLSSTLPEPLEVCYFLSSASEANELAIRLARIFTGSKDLIVLDGAYHGHTTTLIDISPYKHNGPGGQGSPDWVHTAPVADIYRGPFKDPRIAGENYAAAVEELIENLGVNGRSVCGFIAESCPSVGGQIIFPEGYLRGVYASVRRAGGICIADEVQTAYGRLGSAFYGFELQSVVPDIVVLGKPIGNGHPLAAVVTTAEIARAFDNGMEFFSTFGGNNVSCAVGIAVLDVVQREGLQNSALATGQFLLAELEKLQACYDVIGDVRGSGLFLGIELVRDRDSLEPAAEEAKYVVNRMRELGVLVGTDGSLHNVIKIRPPMTFGIPEAKLLVAALKRSFDCLPPSE